MKEEAKSKVKEKNQIVMMTIMTIKILHQTKKHGRRIKRRQVLLCSWSNRKAVSHRRIYWWIAAGMSKNPCVPCQTNWEEKQYAKENDNLAAKWINNGIHAIYVLPLYSFFLPSFLSSSQLFFLCACELFHPRWFRYRHYRNITTR